MEEENQCFGRLLLAALRRHPGKSTAQVEVETGRELKYSHLTRMSLSVVQGLKAEGVGEGTIVAVVSFNSQEVHAFLLAAVFLSVTIVPIDPALNPEEMVQLLEIVTPTVVYTEGGKTLGKVETALALLGLEPKLIVSGRQSHPYKSFQSLLLPTDPEFQPSISDTEEHVDLILFTSGTSGLPKGVMIPDSYLIYNCAMSAGKSVNVNLLFTSPIFWLSGIMIFFTSIMEGMNRIYLRGQAQNAVLLSTIQNYKIALWFTSPSTLMSLLTSSSRWTYDLSSLQMIISGGAALNAENQVRIQRELFRNRVQVYQAYGMTEIGMVTASLPGVNKIGSVGKMKPGVFCKVVDMETGEILKKGMEGEICFKGPYFMKGYYNNPEATLEVYDKDGWLHTGDIGYIDENGFIYVIDRIKDLIKYQVYQIAPAELEAVILSHPAVKDVAVFGIPHPVDGDHATAFVVVKGEITECQLLEFVTERVSENKQLRGGLRFVESIPHTATGKVKKRLLRSQLIAELQGV